MSRKKQWQELTRRDVNKDAARDVVVLLLEDGRLLCWGCGMTELADVDMLEGVLHKFMCRALCRCLAMGVLVLLVMKW